MSDKSRKTDRGAHSPRQFAADTPRVLSPLAPWLPGVDGGPARAPGKGADRRGAITIGIDGRLYCHDLTPGLVKVLLEICPGDRELLARRAALEQESSHA